VLHRDIKPENLLMEDKGYVRITDMGISKIWKSDNENDTSGTPGYMGK
jgi:serine/threonine protein kinase